MALAMDRTLAGLCRYAEWVPKRDVLSHSSPPTRWATSRRMVVVRCWCRAAIAVLDHPITLITENATRYRNTDHNAKYAIGVPTGQW